MTVNDGNGLLDKFGMIDEMLTKIDLLADSKGAFRCGLIWDLTGMLKALKKGLKTEDDAKAANIEELKRTIEDLNGGQDGAI